MPRYPLSAVKDLNPRLLERELKASGLPVATMRVNFVGHRPITGLRSDILVPNDGPVDTGQLNGSGDAITASPGDVWFESLNALSVLEESSLEAVLVTHDAYRSVSPDRLTERASAFIAFGARLADIQADLDRWDTSPPLARDRATRDALQSIVLNLEIVRRALSK